MRRKRSGQITRMRREVLAANQAVLEGVAVGGEVVEQAAETKEAILAGLIAQRGILFAQPAESGEQIRIAPQLGEPAEVREGSVQIGEEVTGRAAIAGHSGRTQGQGEGIDVL